MKTLQLQQEVSPHIGSTGNWPFSHPVHHSTTVSMWDTDVHSSIVFSLFLAAGRGTEAGTAMQMFPSTTFKMFRNVCLPLPGGL